MEKILITGSSGLLGICLLESFGRDYDILGASRNPSDHSTLTFDISDKDDTISHISDIKPDLVIHSAAITDVDYCELNKEEAWKTNVEGTRNIVDACLKTGCKLIYVSTDYVFDGEKGMYKEDDETKAVNYYGLSKLEGEKIVVGSGLPNVIARTSVLYGGYDRRLTHATWMIDKLGKNEEIKMATDRYKCPTLTDNLSEMIKDLHEKDVTGIYHTSGSERISMYDFAVNIAEVFDLDQDLIKPQTTTEFKQPAKRPVDSSLDVSKAEKLGIEIFNTIEGLEYMRDNR